MFILAELSNTEAQFTCNTWTCKSFSIVLTYFKQISSKLVKYRGKKITVLVLLATLLLIQARMPLALLATWALLVHVQLLLTSTPRLFYRRCRGQVCQLNCGCQSSYFKGLSVVLPIATLKINL